MPFFSYGGSSLIVCMVLVALVARVDLDNRLNGGTKAKVTGKAKSKKTGRALA